MKLVVPCDVCIRRFYRGYVTVDENASQDEIRQAMIDAILEDQEGDLTEDPDLFIEEDDISFVNPCMDEAWTEEEDDDIAETLSAIDNRKEQQS